jgi:hypothetical protein
VGLIEQEASKTDSSGISELRAIVSGYSHDCLSIVYEGEYENYTPFQELSLCQIRRAMSPYVMSLLL